MANRSAAQRFPRKKHTFVPLRVQTPSGSTSTQSGSRDEWHGHGPFEKDSTPLGSIHIRTRDVAVCTTKCPSNREVLDSGHQESDMDGSSVRLLRGDQQEFTTESQLIRWARKGQRSSRRRAVHTKKDGGIVRYERKDTHRRSITNCSRRTCTATE